MVIPWNGIALCTSDILGTVLVLRLLSLKLHRVYKVFCAYLLYVLASSSVIFIQASTHALDYRVTYLVIAVGSWTLTLSMVYALLGAILARLPGILTFSRKLLIVVFAAAAVFAAISAEPEIRVASSLYGSWSLKLAVVLASPIERVVTTVSLVALLAIQGFILWFPVPLPRNLVLFSVGFVFNFVCETALLMVRGLLPPAAAGIVDPVNLFVLSASFAYFALVITSAGESIPVRVGHIWRRSEQERLFQQLEEINGALLRSVRN